MPFSGGSADDPYVFGETPLQPRGGNRDLTGKTISDPRLVAGETTGVFVVFGQSNAGNCGNTNYTPTNSTKVDNLNIYDGGTYRGADPLLGCQNIAGVAGTGNMFTRMADKLVTGAVFQRVILIPVAIGGISIADAIVPSFSQRLIVANRRAAAVGLTVTGHLSQIGETDRSLGTSQAAFSAGMTTLMNVTRNAGFNAPWLWAKSTYGGAAVSSAIQAAIDAAVNGTNTFAGANTDTLTGTAVNRQTDDLHLSAAGQDAGATLWKTAIDAVF
jgi:hypothetical protein